MDLLTEGGFDRNQSSNRRKAAPLDFVTDYPLSKPALSVNCRHTILSLCICDKPSFCYDVRTRICLATECLLQILTSLHSTSFQFTNASNAAYLLFAPVAS